MASLGTGALILFGAVQLTMFIVALRGASRSHGCHGPDSLWPSLRKPYDVAIQVES